ncbi:TPA: DUF6685 family protein [Escherichia coli]
MMFPVLRCRELAEPVTEEHLRKNMRHWELRLDRMLFAEYPWAERRLYWLDDEAIKVWYEIAPASAGRKYGLLKV